MCVSVCVEKIIGLVKKNYNINSKCTMKRGKSVLYFINKEKTPAHHNVIYLANNTSSYMEVGS